MNGGSLREFGATGLQVSALGFGAGHIGGNELTESEVGTLLNGVLDLGINLIDTARGYGLSEERIGRHLHQRRHEFVLSTKIGYGIEGYDDWTSPIITAGIDAALRQMQTDYLDIVHFHSCPLETLRAGDVIEALDRAVQAGKVRVAAYSGDNAPLEWAVQAGHFGAIECSVNLADQRVIDQLLPQAQQHQLGVIAKRPVANVAWRFEQRPVGDYAEVYWERLQAMQLDLDPEQLLGIALRFTAYTPGVHSCIVGSRKLAHMQHNLELLQQGPLEPQLYHYLTSQFQAHDRGWVGQI
ncbi:aldo/keto reductase [Herpetosiphon sp. NSE202]|uniref:aldo/keto reductase n=1 Tax=Herpetosiphon sp. NSE202 TaxID=3351349 RepID=UPI00363D9CD7